MAFGSFDQNNSSSHTVSEINMVPLIDVMLVLLVIFIITAPLLSHSININLPQVSGQPIETEPKVIDLAVDENGQVFWNEETVSLEALQAKFEVESKQDPQPDLRIRADLNTRYEVLAEVMSSARKGGMKRIGFVTRPNPDAQGGAAANAPASGQAQVPVQQQAASGVN